MKSRLNKDSEVVKLNTEKIKTHKWFIFSFVITYGLGAIFIWMSCDKEIAQNSNNILTNLIYRSNEQSGNTLNELRVTEIALDSILPTTIVYVLCCLITNFENILNKPDGERCLDWNIITVISLFFYVLIYSIYMHHRISAGWIILEIIITLLILFFNVCCYKESISKRSHSLTK